MPLTYSDGSVCLIDEQARSPILSDKRKPCHARWRRMLMVYDSVIAN